MAKKMRKILNPNLVSKKEQKEIKQMVRKALKGYSFRDALKNTREKVDRHN